MPNARGSLKRTGDIHLPDAESDLAIEEGTSSLAALARMRDQRGRPPARRAGVLVAPEDEARAGARAGARDAATARRALPRGSAGRDAPGEGKDGGAPRMPPQPRRPWALWLGALAAAAVLVRLMR